MLFFKEDEVIYHCHLSDNEKYEDVVGQLQNVKDLFCSGSLVDGKLKMFSHFVMDYLCSLKETAWLVLRSAFYQYDFSRNSNSACSYIMDIRPDDKSL